MPRFPFLLAALALSLPPCAATAQSRTSEPAAAGSRLHWRGFAAGFITSIGLHEAAHIGAALAAGGRPSFGLDRGRPTVYSGIDASQQPTRQFAFSAAGLTMQSVIDEALLDVPRRAEPASSFERGVLAGGIGTALFYVTLGRTGSVSDVEYMARTSTWSKDQISLLYGGVAVLHALRITRDDRFGGLFVRPGLRGGLHLGFDLSRGR